MQLHPVGFWTDIFTRRWVLLHFDTKVVDLFSAQVTMELSRWLRASQKGSTERVFPPMSSTSVRWNDLYSFNSLCSDGIQVRTGFVSLGQQQISDRRDLRNLVGGGFQ